MQAKNLKTSTVIAVILAAASPSAVAQPSDSVCGTTSTGKQLCVRFDNLPTTPQPDVDFSFDLGADPENPRLELLRGRNTQGTIMEWRVWCKDSQNNPANIGEIKALADYDFDVKVLDPNGSDGVANLALVNLDPSGADKYANLTDARIAGDLTGNVAVQRSSGGAGGEVSLLVGGDVAEGASITIPVLRDLTVQGDLAGAIVVQSDIPLAGKFNIMGQLTATGVVDFQHSTIYSDTVTFDGGSGVIRNGIIGAGAGVTLASNDEADFSGTATFDRVETDGDLLIHGGTISGTIVVTGDHKGAFVTQGGDLAASALIRIEGELGGCIAIKRLVHWSGDMPGQIVVLGRHDGEIEVGGNLTGSVRVHNDMSGDIKVAHDMTGSIVIDQKLTSTGRIMIDGTNDGLVQVRKYTQNLSLIRMRHFASNGIISIDANTPSLAVVAGTIHIGSIAPLAPEEEPVT
jgi:hypothetical protein